MIQRIQSIFLFLASALFGTFSFLEPATLMSMAGNTAIPAFVSLASGLIALVSIFLFKNRGSQKKVVYLSILLGVVSLALLFVFYHWEQVVKLWPVFLLPVGIIMNFFALRGINKDEKLIKSLDRLR